MNRPLVNNGARFCSPVDFVGYVVVSYKQVIISRGNTSGQGIANILVNQPLSIMNGIQRGALIVLEGCDRVGKTTQCKLLGK